MGSDFALLHPDFLQRRPAQARQIEKIQRVGIFFGGSDLTCETRKVLEAISQTKVCADWQVEVILGKQHKDSDAIVSLLPPAQLTVYDRIDEMAGFIARQDVFFGACGVSALERCCLGVPSFGVVIADNQQVIARNLASSEGLILVGDGRETTAGTWARVINEKLGLKLLNEVAIKAHRLCDGRGVERVCREIQL
jgi:spore coat polysaccharide biosynthesis predicted glycosyltransferase SpsG